MALVAADLGTVIAAALNTQMTSLYPQSAAGLAPYHGAMAAAIADAVVAYLQANAEVTPDGSPAMAAGATAVTGKGKVG